MDMNDHRIKRLFLFRTFQYFLFKNLKTLIYIGLEYKSFDYYKHPHEFFELIKNI